VKLIAFCAKNLDINAIMDAMIYGSRILEEAREHLFLKKERKQGLRPAYIHVVNPSQPSPKIVSHIMHTIVLKVHF